MPNKLQFQLINFSNGFWRPKAAHFGEGLCNSWRTLSLTSSAACHPLKGRNVHKILVIPGQTIILKCPWDIPGHHVRFEKEWPCFPSSLGSGCPRQWCVMPAVQGLKGSLCHITFAFLWPTGQLSTGMPVQGERWLLHSPWYVCFWTPYVRIL